MSGRTRGGWAEVFRGPCLQAALVQAVLEANGLAPLTQRSGPEGVFSGLAFEECGVLVPDREAERAQEILAAGSPSPGQEGGAGRS